MLILVEKVVVNKSAGELDIVFHDLVFLEAVDRRLDAGGAHEEAVDGRPEDRTMSESLDLQSPVSSLRPPPAARRP